MEPTFCSAKLSQLLIRMINSLCLLVRIYDGCGGILNENWKCASFCDCVLRLQWQTKVKVSLWFLVILSWKKSSFLRISHTYGKYLVFILMIFKHFTHLYQQQLLKWLDCLYKIDSSESVLFWMGRNFVLFSHKWSCHIGIQVKRCRNFGPSKHNCV